MTTQEKLVTADARMRKAIEALVKDMSGIRTGRANPSLVEGLLVEHYGATMPLNQLANISAPEARLITVQPWDKTAIQSIEKAILKANLGFNPSNDGTVIRLAIPQLTEERRLEMVKTVRKRVEEGKVSLRNVRREVQDEIRALEKDKMASQDDVRRAQDQLQAVTDKFIAQIDDLVKKKEAELMAV
ncbi:MAG: ribosome recycling factor [Dehalococcoidia bacterium]|nr:ribosome recycling factor [Dehalococcoidia bacterium]